MKTSNSPKDNQIALPLNKLPLVSRCDYLTCVDGFVHPDRVMNVNVLLYVEKGSFHLFEEDEEFDVSAGSLIFLKQGLHHFGDTKCPDGTSWFFVHFNLEDGGDTVRLKPFEEYRFDEDNPERAVGSVVLPKKVNLYPGSRILAKMFELRDMFQSSGNESFIRMNLLLYEILIELYEEERLNSHEGTDEKRVTDIKKLVENNINRPFDSQMFSDNFGLTYKHLNSIFKNITGNTIQKFYSEVRMDHAAALLRGTDLSVREVADRFGFEEVNYFSNSFKKRFGVSPSEYRHRIVAKTMKNVTL